MSPQKKSGTQICLICSTNTSMKWCIYEHLAHIPMVALENFIDINDNVYTYLPS
jgi:hypothetical protein